MTSHHSTQEGLGSAPPDLILPSISAYADYGSSVICVICYFPFILHVNISHIIWPLS